MKDDEKSPPFAGTEIFTFREGELWMACWRRFDVTATAKNEKQAIDNLLRKIGVHAVVMAENNYLSMDAVCDPVSEKLVARWQRLFEEWHD